MKKTYFAPAMEIVKIQTHQMLASSPESMGFEPDTNENPSNSDAPGFEFVPWAI